MVQQQHEGRAESEQRVHGAAQPAARWVGLPAGMRRVMVCDGRKQKKGGRGEAGGAERSEQARRGATNIIQVCDLWLSCSSQLVALSARWPARGKYWQSARGQHRSRAVWQARQADTAVPPPLISTPRGGPRHSLALAHTVEWHRQVLAREADIRPQVAAAAPGFRQVAPNLQK